MTVGGVFTEAGVGDDHHLRIFRFDGFAGPLYGFVVVPGAAAFFIFVRGEAEQQHSGDAQLYCFVYGFHHPVHRPLVIVFQGFNFVLYIFARYHKQGENQIFYTEACLPDQAAQVLGSAQAAGTVNGKTGHDVNTSFDYNLYGY